MRNKLKHALFVLPYFIIGVLYQYFNKPINGNVHSLMTSIDRSIPFVKAFIIPYYIWYVFIGFTILFLLVNNTREYYKYVICLCVSELICICIYLVFQTTVPRPIVDGNDFLSILVKNIYEIDRPYNCFPSIHVLTTSITMIFLWKNKDLKTWFKIMIQIVGISIILSTLFVKQHAIIDAVAGGILAVSTVRFINIMEEVGVRYWKKRQYLSLTTKKKYEI
ncbi:inositol phosphorylceramide synthase [Clostridium sp. YIM B02505]|uniref:Inositol phosphorylceramide synthase n=1 Tax=Clostridium yunnanense TaxID=2800325 RepID=A0ABS1EXE0_9CLOT|nr:phosphatase PAP2 family protein [Clostridium yunnanense]MBK1813980.1 inositol phosphorylceramide synthase [Clostridium yunnanense]